MRDLQLSFISNQATKRLFQLLNVMEQERLFTLGEMSEQMHVTQRTIWSDIKYLKDYFSDCIQLVAGNSGVLFEVKNPSIYKKRKQELLENECLFEIIEDIFQGKLADVDELANHYHFSESTFRRLLKQTDPTLASYGLRWSSNPLTIEGNEANLRKFFKDFYYEGVDTAYTLVPDSGLHELVLNNLDGQLGQYDIGSGTTVEAFYYTFFIAIKRASLGFQITVPEKLTELAYKGKNFSLLYSLKEGIKELYNVELAEEEFAWVYLVTICKRTLEREDQEQKFYQECSEDSTIAQLTDDYLEAFELTEDSYFKIRTFLRSFFLSRKINHLLGPALNKEASDVKEAIIRSDNKNYQNNLNFLKKQQKTDFLSSAYLDDICVSLTIYSGLIFDFYTPAKRIYFLLEGDHFICQQIRTRATQQFGTKHSLTFVPLQQLKQEVLNARSIDLVVTNYDRYLSNYLIETDHFLLKPVPDEHDWQQLAQKIDPYRMPFFNACARSI